MPLLSASAFLFLSSSFFRRHSVVRDTVATVTELAASGTGTGDGDGDGDGGGSGPGGGGGVAGGGVAAGGGGRVPAV